MAYLIEMMTISDQMMRETTPRTACENSEPWALAALWPGAWLPRQWDSPIIIAVAADAALVLLAAIWWLWRWLPDFRKTAGQALGGAGAGVLADGKAKLGKDGTLDLRQRQLVDRLAQRRRIQLMRRL